MKNFAIVFLNLILSCAAVSAQEKYQTPDFLTVKTDKGMMLVNNNKPKPFAVLIPGKEISAQQAGSGILFLVDGKVLNVAFADVRTFLGENKTADAAEILKLHQLWEMEFQENTVFKQKIPIDEETFVFLNLLDKESQQTFFWTYTRPDTRLETKDLQFDRDCLQTTLIDNLVLMIGSPLAPNAKITETRRLLNEVLGSLTFLPSQMQTPVKEKAAPLKPSVKTAPKAQTVKRKRKKN